VVVDPVGLAPAVLGVTEGLSQSVRREVGPRASVIAVAVLAGVALIGDWLLRQLGITGDIVLSRLLGLIHAALAVQFVIDGVRAVIVSS
jgi:small neutral amino acid transporter SnatA (MarC family)